MSNSNSQRINLDILPLIAALVGASISIFFSRLSISDLHEGSNDPACFMTIITVFTLYFFAFYSISRILLSKTLSIYLLGGIFLSSLFIMFIGVSDVRGRFLHVYLGFLITTLLITLWKAGIKEMQKWDVFFIYLFLLSSAYTAINSSGLQINDEDVQLYTERYDGSGYVHATLSIQMTALKYDAKNIRVKIICSDQVFLDGDECAFSSIDILEKDETGVVRWDIMFDGRNSHSFFLYLISSDEICNKKITIDFEDGSWEARIRDVNFLENLLIFFKNNTIF